MDTVLQPLYSYIKHTVARKVDGKFNLMVGSLASDYQIKIRVAYYIYLNEKYINEQMHKGTKIMSLSFCR